MVTGHRSPFIGAEWLEPWGADCGQQVTPGAQESRSRSRRSPRAPRVRSQTKDNAEPGVYLICPFKIVLKCFLCHILFCKTFRGLRLNIWMIKKILTLLVSPVTAPLLLTGPWKGNMMYSILLQLPALLLQKYTLTFPMSAIKEKFFRNINCIL